jgi:hypothetical protein
MSSTTPLPFHLRLAEHAVEHLASEKLFIKGPAGAMNRVWADKTTQSDTIFSCFWTLSSFYYHFK